MSATPAADPTDSMLPPTPHVSVISSQHQRGGQVVQDGRQEEADRAGEPEQLAVSETAAHQFCPHRLEHVALVDRRDERHRDDQEEKQARKLHEDGPECILNQVCLETGRQAGLERDQAPDHGGCKHDGLGLAQARALLHHHEHVGNDEGCQHRVPGEFVRPPQHRRDGFGGRGGGRSEQHGQDRSIRDHGSRVASPRWLAPSLRLGRWQGRETVLSVHPGHRAHPRWRAAILASSDNRPDRPGGTSRSVRRSRSPRKYRRAAPRRGTRRHR